MLWLDLSSLCVSDCPYCIPSLSEMLWLCLEKVFCPHLIVKDLERLGDILSQRHFIPRIFCPRHILSQLFSALRNFVTTSLSYPETFCPAFIFRPQKNPKINSVLPIIAQKSSIEPSTAKHSPVQPSKIQYSPVWPSPVQLSTVLHYSQIQCTFEHIWETLEHFLYTFEFLWNTHLSSSGTFWSTIEHIWVRSGQVWCGQQGLGQHAKMLMLALMLKI